MRKTIPVLKPSLVHFESKSDVSLALSSVKEEPEEQAKGKDDKNKAGSGATVWKMADLLQLFN